MQNFDAQRSTCIIVYYLFINACYVAILAITLEAMTPAFRRHVAMKEVATYIDIDKKMQVRLFDNFCRQMSFDSSVFFRPQIL